MNTTENRIDQLASGGLLEQIQRLSSMPVSVMSSLITEEVDSQEEADARIHEVCDEYIIIDAINAGLAAHGDPEDWEAPEFEAARKATEGYQWNFEGWKPTLRYVEQGALANWRVPTKSVVKTATYAYIIKTDGVQDEIEATSSDEAARLFAEDEFPGKGIQSVEDLFAHIDKIGDGAWCWIEGDDAPDGARQSS